MKRQKATSNAGFLDGAAARGKKGKKNSTEQNDKYDFDYEFDSYDADEWEDSFEKYKYQ